MAAIGVTPSTPRRRFLLATVALLALVAIVMIGELNSVLSSMRSDGGIAGNLTDLTVRVVPPRVPTEADVQGVITSWRAYDAGVVQAAPELNYAGPISTVNAALRLDSFLLVPLYAILAICLVLWARTWPPAPPGQPGARALAAVARSWLLLAVLGVTVVANEVENWFVGQVIDEAWNGKLLDGQDIVVVAGMVKWIGLAIVFAPFAVVGVRRLAGVLRPVVRTAWFPLLLIVLLAIASATDQAADVVRRWGLGQVVWSLLAIGVLAMAIGACGSRSFQIGRTPITVRAQGQPFSLAALLRAALTLAPVAVVAVGCLLAAGALQWRGLLVLACVLLVAFALSLPIRHYWELQQTVEVPAVQTAPPPLRHKIGVALAAAVPLLVGLAVVRATTASVFYRSDGGSWLNRDLVALLGGILLTVAGSLLAGVIVGYVLLWMADGGRVRRWTMLGVLFAAVALPSGLMVLRSTSMAVAQGLGSVAVVLMFLSVLALIASLLHVLGDGALRSRWIRDAALPPAVRVLGFERPPLVGLFVLWVVLAALLTPGDYHDVRQLSRSGVDIQTRSISDVFRAWGERQPDAGTAAAGQPLVVVAASGGGLRSAYWTTLVLDCVLERNPDPVTGDPCGTNADADTVTKRRARLFAMSGVAGGGLGLVTYDTHLDVDGTRAERDWFDRRLAEDFLSPTVAWGLFRDSLATLLRPGTGRDRASALERAWEHPWRQDGDAFAEPFLTDQSTLEGPLLLLNSFSVEDGCRLSTSVVLTAAGRPVDECGSLDPSFTANDGTLLNGTTDVAAFLCLPGDRDLRRSTAALLGARFPLITPAGRLVASCSADQVAGPTSHAVDGGLRDSSAASTLAELWPHVQPLVDNANAAQACIVPYFVQLDSDEDVLPSSSPNASPNELASTVEALRSVPGGNADAARVAAQRLFSGPVDQAGRTAELNGEQLLTRWQRIAPRTHPGATEANSWVLSGEAREDLRRQVAFNGDAIAQLRALLDAAPGAISCKNPTGS